MYEQFLWNLVTGSIALVSKYMLLVLLLLFASFDVCCFEFLMTVKHLTECGIQAAMCSPQAPERWQDVWERDVSGELALCFSEVPIASIADGARRVKSKPA